MIDSDGGEDCPLVNPSQTALFSQMDSKRTTCRTESQKILGPALVKHMCGKHCYKYRLHVLGDSLGNAAGLRIS